MPVVPRPRRYVRPILLVVLRPLFRYSSHRGAYVLRVVGANRGPVLRPDQRRRHRDFDGPDRRRAMVRTDGHAIAGR